MCILPHPTPDTTPRPSSPAKALTPQQRQQLALQALAGTF